MITVSFDNNTQNVHINSVLTMDNLQIIHNAMQAQVTEILTGPDNSHDKLRELSDSANKLGIELDLSTDTALTLVDGEQAAV